MGRRRIFGYGISAVLALLPLAACADMQSTPRDPNKKPFWEREEQRD